MNSGLRTQICKKSILSICIGVALALVLTGSSYANPVLNNVLIWKCFR